MGLTLHRAQPAKQVLHALHVRFKSRNALPRLSINLTMYIVSKAALEGRGLYPIIFGPKSERLVLR